MAGMLLLLDMHICVLNMVMPTSWCKLDDIVCVFCGRHVKTAMS